MKLKFAEAIVKFVLLNIEQSRENEELMKLFREANETIWNHQGRKDLQEKSEEIKDADIKKVLKKTDNSKETTFEVSFEFTFKNLQTHKKEDIHNKYLLRELKKNLMYYFLNTPPSQRSEEDLKNMIKDDLLFHLFNINDQKSFQEHLENSEIKEFKIYQK